MIVKQNRSCLFEKRSALAGSGEMKSIAFIFQKFREELSEKELRELSNEADKFVYEQTIEINNIETQIQLVLSVKTHVKKRLKNFMMKKF